LLGISILDKKERVLYFKFGLQTRFYD